MVNALTSHMLALIVYSIDDDIVNCFK
jgi:hypothetical protein